MKKSLNYSELPGKVIQFEKKEDFCCGISVSYTTGLEEHSAFFGIWWVAFEGVGREGLEDLLVLL